MAWNGVPYLGGEILPKEKVACYSCELRSYRVGGASRCVAWKRFRTITRCSNYKGPKPDLFLFQIGDGEHGEFDQREVPGMWGRARRVLDVEKKKKNSGGYPLFEMREESLDEEVDDNGREAEDSYRG